MSETHCETLAERMALYQISHFLPDDKDSFILRIDGHNFSSYLGDNGYHDYFDERIHSAMIDIGWYFVENWDGAFAFETHSDEISIFFCKRRQMSQKTYGGKLNKLLSLSASLAAVIFSQKIKTVIPEDGATPSYFHFDSRAIVPPDLSEMSNYLLWRNKDCFNNAAQTFYRRCVNKSKKTKPLEEILKSVPVDELDPSFLHGTIGYLTHDYHPKMISKKLNYTTASEILVDCYPKTM